MTDWKTYKNQKPWAFEPQQNKYGYRNNPRWVDLTDAASVETLSPVWPMTEGQMSAGETNKHSPCGYWYSTEKIEFRLIHIGIGFTSYQMSVGESQTFTGIDEDGNEVDTSGCVWSVVSGGGSITQQGVYTAPATNPNCANNPSITLTCLGILMGTITIAVNALSLSCGDAAIEYCVKRSDVYSPHWICCTRWYNCLGEIELSNCHGSSIHCNNYGCFGGYPTYSQSSLMSDSEQWILGQCSGHESGIFDKRTDAMKTQGCCPEQLL